MKQLTDLMQKQFEKMCATGKLFTVQVDNLWDKYLQGFENDPVFRDPNSTVHNCNTCHSFVKRYGNIVSIDSDFNLMSIWDVDIEGEFNNVTKELSNYIKSSKINNVFFESYNDLDKLLNYQKVNKNQSLFQLGIDFNRKLYTGEEAKKYGVVNSTDVYTFNHLHLNIPKEFINFSKESLESIFADYRTAKEVFKRGLDEISLDVLNLIVELSEQGSLLNMDSHIHKVKEQVKMKTLYSVIPDKQKDNWCWVNSYKYQYAKFRNELIGVFAVELSTESLEKACLNWNKRVDPSNYMKAVAPITETQRKLAEKFVLDNGYVESFNRRLATIEDIKVSEILHINNSTKKLKSISLFDGVVTKSNDTKINKDKLPRITIDQFMSEVVPNSTSLELYLENKFEGNLVNMTTTVDVESKPIFKYSNNYSITYNGGLAGKSQIKEAVKTAGGKVDGLLRFSIMWADGNEDNSDLDAHCKESAGNEIYYVNKRSYTTSGNLDVDIQRPNGKLAVENITYPSLKGMKDGSYFDFYVNQFANRNSKGFEAEIEFEGQTYHYVYNQNVNGKVNVTRVTYKDGKFNIVHHLPCNSINVSKNLWGLESNNFHKVNLFCLSPNHWDDNKVGNKHYLFMLENCINPDKVRSFHNEDFKQELLEHRKVLDILGAKCLVESVSNQLAGVGFNATVKEEFVVKTNNKMYLVTI